MSSTVVGYVQKYGKKEMWNWAMSLKKHYTGNVVVIACEIEQDAYDWLKSLGFTVYVHPPSNTAAVVTRFLYLYKLIENGKITSEWVMMCDVKDVIFQDDVLEYHKEFEDINCSWVAGGENVKYEDEPWGRENLQQSFPHSWETMKNAEIINAGTFSARTEVMADICKLVYYMCLNNRIHNSDQAALNVLWQTGIMPRSTCSIMNQYAIQLGTTADPTKPLKQIKEGIVQWDDNGLVYNAQKDPYCIIHQYDRVPELKALIDARYSTPV